MGVGQLRNRSTELADAREPADLIADAIGLALADTTVADAARSAVDSLDVVNVTCWPYADLPALLAGRAGIAPAHRVHSDVGGNQPPRLVDAAARRIDQGRSRVAVVCGGESYASLNAFRKNRQTPPWTPPPPDARLPEARDFVTDLAYRHGLVNPTQVYPLYEHGLRAARGQSLSENLQESARLYAAFSEVAAQNPAAWNPTPQTAEEIATVTPRNRWICHPYPLYMNALLNVNQAAAVVLADVEAARTLGVPEGRWIYVWGGAGSKDSSDFLARRSYSRSPAMEATLDATLAAVGLTVDAVDLFDLYSCFPIIPKLAARHLGLALERQLTVTGGLTAFGGPGNNYSLHSVVSMVDALRRGAGQTGLIYGNGEYVTKHHAVVLCTHPRRGAYPAENPLPEEFVEAPAPALVEHALGTATIETYTVEYSRAGEPERGFIVGRLASGERFVANTPEGDQEILALLTDGSVEPIGLQGHVGPALDGRNIFRVVFPDAGRDANEAVLSQRCGAVLVLTINRPAARNAINPAVTEGLDAALNAAEQDDTIAAVVLTGAGDRSFSAGMDLKHAAQHGSMGVITARGGFAGIVKRQFPKPLIAAVNGTALGGGFEIALSCDLIVAAEHAVFGLPEVKRGLIAGAGGLIKLGRLLPRPAALEIAMTGEPISAQRAQQLGLVSRVVPAAALLDTALALAELIAANGPLAVRLSKQLVDAAPDLTIEEAWQRNDACGAQIARSDDMREGLQAFAEKRRPVWKRR